MGSILKISGLLKTENSETPLSLTI